jgi:hypothetical protein
VTSCVVGSGYESFPIEKIQPIFRWLPTRFFQVFEMLPAFSCISCACAFSEVDDASIFFSGLVEAEGGTSVAAPAGWLFWNLMTHPLLVEEDSTFLLGEAVRA